MTRRTALTVLAGVLASAPVNGQSRNVEVAESPLVGEWVVDVSRSTISPLFPMTRGTLSVAVAPDGSTITMSSGVTMAAGLQQQASETFRTDGTETPSGQTPGITLVATFLDPHVFAMLAKKGGQVFLVAIYEVSPDRKTTTSRSWGMVEQTIVFERVR
jgi:hypothetical protein